MLRGFQKICRDKIVVLQEITAHIRNEEHDDREYDKKNHDSHHVFHCVIRVERDAIEGDAGFRVLVFLDFDAVRIIRAYFVQRNHVRRYQSQQHQRHCDYVKREKAVKCGVGNRIVAAYPQRKIGADQGDCVEQVDDHLRTPV